MRLTTPNPVASGLSVLLIDDDPTFHFVHERLLRSSGIAKQVNTALNGKVGLDYLQETISLNTFPDLILVDIEMPVMNGLEFLAAFNAINPDIRRKIFIAVLSSSLNPQHKILAEQFGIDFYMNKPLPVDKLRLALSTTAGYNSRKVIGGR